jgi:translocation and assembly module TamB
MNLNRFDLAMLKPFMPEATQASGVFSGKADVAGTPPKRGCRREVSRCPGNVKVTQEVNDAPLPVAFDTLNLSADLHNNRAELGWLIRLTNNGQLDGQVQITDPQGRRNLGGNVNIRNFSLAMITRFSRAAKKPRDAERQPAPGGNGAKPAAVRPDAAQRRGYRR